MIYKNIYPNPRNWYDHYLYLAKSFINGHVDIPNLPQFYHDKLEFKGKTYIPFPPGASLLLVSFIALKRMSENPYTALTISPFFVVKGGRA